MQIIRRSLIVILLLAASGSSLADVWRWVDANGNTHFVDSNRPIWTWSDDSGRIFYSDTPDHEDAIRVQLFWHSAGTLDQLDQQDTQNSSAEKSGGYAYPGETAEKRAQREAAVAHNCKRANEILKSYENAPKLYRTDAEGQRHILTEDEYAQELAEARRKTEFLCNQ